MSANEIIILILIGLSAGMIAGALGVGGAIIIVPALVFFFSMPQHLAQGTSLAILLFPVGLLAFLNYYKHGYVNFKVAIIVMLAFIVGGYFGSLISVNLPEKPLKVLFGALMLIAGMKMILGK
ncbi:MAG: sulfite exporter TauE/SafE family protein [Bacteroidales bacterium]|nr:sulfite exporter TauE/SafE family protein [Bacteroidales bacterium]